MRENGWLSWKIRLRRKMCSIWSNACWRWDMMSDGWERPCWNIRLLSWAICRRTMPDSWRLCRRRTVIIVSVTIHGRWRPFRIRWTGIVAIWRPSVGNGLHWRNSWLCRIGSMCVIRCCTGKGSFRRRIRRVPCLNGLNDAMRWRVPRFRKNSWAFSWANWNRPLWICNWSSMNGNRRSANRYNGLARPC